MADQGVGERLIEAVNAQLSALAMATVTQTVRPYSGDSKRFNDWIKGLGSSGDYNRRVRGEEKIYSIAN